MTRWLVLVVAALSILSCRPRREEARVIVELRSYTLKPGTRDRFDELFVKASLPLLDQANIDVVSWGPSLHDADSYFLMRAYATLEDRERREAAFYGSDAWKKGPREAVLADIEGYTTVVLELDRETVDRLRRARP